MLLVTAARDVIGEDPAAHGAEVETGEHRDHGQALHRHRKVRPDHGREPVGLALEREQGALDLLVVLELDLEQLHDLDGQAGGARDPDGGVLVGGEDLVHVAVGDQVAHGGAAVPRHDDPAVIR